MTEQTEQQAFWQTYNLPAPGAALSAAAYRALPETAVPMEHIGGRIVYPHWSEETMSPTPTPDHQRIVLRLAQLLSGAIPDGEIFLAPMDVRLGADTVQPDLFWIRADNTRCIEHANYFAGPPDLTVEILSPSNAANDRVTKYNLYEGHAVSEYWLVDGAERIIEVYRHDGAAFQRAGAYTDGTFQSPVLGKTVDVGGVFSAR